MITPVFRRIAIPFGLLVVALAFGFDAYVTRSGCASVPGCPPRALLVVTTLGLLAALVLAYLVARRTVQPLSLIHIWMAGSSVKVARPRT